MLRSHSDVAFSSVTLESRWLPLPSSNDAECLSQRETGTQAGPTGSRDGFYTHGTQQTLG